MRGFLRIMLVLATLTGVGVGWFRFVDGWSWVDAIYMSVITLSTVGYTEVRPLSELDKLFVCCYLAIGLGAF
ncbi:MAG: two pore domain potassium channel family protein, partial [Planctomycetales bacterium]|nr:two pore domain potassium channel family protein [Planctomycetales bacterium]